MAQLPFLPLPGFLPEASQSPGSLYLYYLALSPYPARIVRTLAWMLTANAYHDTLSNLPFTMLSL